MMDAPTPSEKSTDGGSANGDDRPGRARVRFIHPRSDARFEAEVSLLLTGAEALKALVAHRFIDDGPMRRQDWDYRLQHCRTGREIRSSGTFGEAGVLDGDEIAVYEHAFGGTSGGRIDASSSPEGFFPIGETPEPIVRIGREGARTGYRVFRGRDGFEAAIPETVIERMVVFGRAAAPKEWFGLIAARICEDVDGRHLVVLGVVPDPDAVAHPYYVETTPDSELRTRLALRTLYPDGSVVGWVHGHIRVGANYSSTDRKTQTTWTQPHSLGIVVDPWDPKEIAVYRGPECEELKQVAEDEESTSPAATERFTPPSEAMPVGGGCTCASLHAFLLRDRLRLRAIHGLRPAKRSLSERLLRVAAVAIAALAVVFAVLSRDAADRAGRRAHQVAAKLTASERSLRREIAASEDHLELIIADGLSCAVPGSASCPEPASVTPPAPSPVKRGVAKRGTSPRSRNAGIAHAMGEVRTRGPRSRETP